MYNSEGINSVTDSEYIEMNRKIQAIKLFLFDKMKGVRSDFVKYDRFAINDRIAIKKRFAIKMDKMKGVRSDFVKYRYHVTAFKFNIHGNTIY